VQHGLEVAQYRVRWNLPPDHPVTAPAYSDRARRWRSKSGSAVGGPPPSRRPRRGGVDARAGRRRTSQDRFVPGRSEVLCRICMCDNAERF
jgi:hypothetical protein